MAALGSSPRGTFGSSPRNNFKLKWLINKKNHIYMYNTNFKAPITELDAVAKDGSAVTSGKRTPSSESKPSLFFIPL